ncbi:MAG: ATP-binding protein, partial [Armatimonadetes bacterium]|nr:ATP-binding protein [Armatimonadota bacterium]
VHGGGGTASFHGDPEAGQLQICITDNGTGIAEETLHRATLERGYTTAGSLGLGFSLMYSAADRVYLLTGATGTTLLLEQSRESPGARELWF